MKFKSLILIIVCTAVLISCNDSPEGLLRSANERTEPSKTIIATGSSESDILWLDSDGVSLNGKLIPGTQGSYNMTVLEKTVFTLTSQGLFSFELASTQTITKVQGAPEFSTLYYNGWGLSKDLKLYRLDDFSTEKETGVLSVICSTKDSVLTKTVQGTYKIVTAESETINIDNPEGVSFIGFQPLEKCYLLLGNNRYCYKLDSSGTITKCSKTTDNIRSKTTYSASFTVNLNGQVIAVFQTNNGFSAFTSQGNFIDNLSYGMFCGAKNGNVLRFLKTSDYEITAVTSNSRFYVFDFSDVSQPEPFETNLQEFRASIAIKKSEEKIWPEEN